MVYKSDWHSYEQEPLSNKDRSRQARMRQRGTKQHAEGERSPSVEEVLQGETTTIKEWD